MQETFVFELAILLAAAFAGGLLVRRLGYPMALGELLIGIVIGPFAFGFVRQTEMVSMFAELGAIILLFYIGLETEMGMLKKYFLPSIMVAISGAILPLILGYYGGILIGFSWQESLFLGTVLTATSLGITVRMLTAMKKLHTPFGMVILGAGIIDDVIAVVMLTIVLDILAGQLDFGSIGMILFEVVAFFSVILVVGTRVLTKVLDSTRITIENLLIILLSLCFLVAYLASELGLSTIIGAFAIGVSLSGLKRILTVLQKGKSLYIFFVPIFFISIGMLIDINLFTNNIIPALFITVIAMAGKVGGCGIAALITGSSRKNALRIGIGMSPRGEMGLIIAGIGLASGTIGGDIFTISIIAVVFTTLIGMPALKIILKGSIEPQPKKEDIENIETD
jgi:Kef-type K+ transport system membrane component KefB